MLASLTTSIDSIRSKYYGIDPDIDQCGCLADYRALVSWGPSQYKDVVLPVCITTVLSLTWEYPYQGKTVFILRRGPGCHLSTNHFCMFAMNPFWMLFQLSLPGNARCTKWIKCPLWTFGSKSKFHNLKIGRLLDTKWLYHHIAYARNWYALSSVLYVLSAAPTKLVILHF